MIIRIIVDVLYAYIIVLFVRLILTWFPMDPWSPWAKAVRFLARFTDPVLAPIRRIIPPLRMGGMAVDLSPITLFIVLEIVIQILQAH